jgi:hypothetical protein
VPAERAAVLVCYEQVIVWPLLFSMANRPTVIVAIANNWWAERSTIPELRRNCVRTKQMPDRSFKLRTNFKDLMTAGNVSQ